MPEAAGAVEVGLAQVRLAALRFGLLAHTQLAALAPAAQVVAAWAAHRAYRWEAVAARRREVAAVARARRLVAALVLLANSVDFIDISICLFIFGRKYYIYVLNVTNDLKIIEI